MKRKKQYTVLGITQNEGKCNTERKKNYKDSKTVLFLVNNGV